MTLFGKIYRHFFPPPKTEHEKTVEEWMRDKGDKILRLTYALTPDDIVWDVGGYEGQWASDLFSKYQPTIHIFEPVSLFAKEITDRFASNPKMHIHVYGLSNEDTTNVIALTKDRSSTFIDGKVSEQASFRKASTIIDELGTPTLIKINIEGGEYPLLEDLITTEKISGIKYIQVQFHSFVPDAKERMERIQETLSHTHTCTYSYPFVWENWTRNDN